MDPENEFKRQIASLMRVMCATRYLKEDTVPCEIAKGLFLGSVGAANNKSLLKKKNITHVLTVASMLSPAHPNDFVYKVIGVADREDTNLAQYFDECFDFIDEAQRQGGCVLVHCFVGRSRSVTIVVAYLMKKYGLSASQALGYVKRRRQQAGPNSGFIAQLEEFEKSLPAPKTFTSTNMEEILGIQVIKTDEGGLQRGYDSEGSSHSHRRHSATLPL